VPRARYPRHRDIRAYRDCRRGSRGQRAAEGAALGAVVGIVAGSIMTGVMLVGAKSKTIPILVGIGVFGVAAIGQAVLDAAPPEC
jgi:hypothetical protein